MSITLISITVILKKCAISNSTVSFLIPLLLHWKIFAYIYIKWNTFIRNWKREISFHSHTFLSSRVVINEWRRGGCSLPCGTRYRGNQLSNIPYSHPLYLRVVMASMSLKNCWERAVSELSTSTLIPLPKLPYPEICQSTVFLRVYDQSDKTKLYAMKVEKKKEERKDSKLKMEVR